MLPLNDPRWKELDGGYRIPFDASVPLKAMEAGADVWSELWDELHHQGDLGLASYAAVPHLVRIAAAASFRNWNLYALVSTIEIERHRKSNPAIPTYLKDSYFSAWSKLLELAVTDLKSNADEITLRSILAAIALAKGDLKLGALIAYFDTSEIEQMLEDTLAWSDLYG